MLRKLARFKQIGNLKNKAPLLTSEQNSAERLETTISKADDVFVWKLENATCNSSWGGTVIDKNNKVYDRFVSFPWGKEYHPTFSSPYLGRTVATLEKAIFLITPEAKGNYYHWVIDLLPRLLLIKNLSLEDFNERVIILHWPVRKYENDVLSLLQIKPKKVIRLKAFENIHVNDLIVADYINYGETFPIWKKELLHQLKPIYSRQNSLKGKHIYLVRGKQKIRQLIGEELLIEALKNEDFEIVDPQLLSFTEQIEKMSTAQIVIGLHGAALTNIIFCKKRTLIIEIRSTIKPPEFFSMIASTCNLQFKTISVSPKHEYSKSNIANKQNLVLESNTVNDLITQIKTFRSEERL